MRVFATKVFDRFARKERLDDRRLCEAVARTGHGLIDADLGGGRSGGYRTIFAFRAAERCVFLYGFAKSERESIDGRELDDLKKLARHFLSYNDEQIAKALSETELREVMCDAQEEK